MRLTEEEVLGDTKTHIQHVIITELAVAQIREYGEFLNEIIRHKRLSVEEPYAILDDHNPNEAWKNWQKAPPYHRCP
jgi:hypothetical protein